LRRILPNVPIVQAQGTKGWVGAQDSPDVPSFGKENAILSPSSIHCLVLASNGISVQLEVDLIGRERGVTTKGWIEAQADLGSAEEMNTTREPSPFRRTHTTDVDPITLPWIISESVLKSDPFTWN
jgi:hypothetical protein